MSYVIGSQKQGKAEVGSGGQKVLIIGSYAPSLILFRGALIAEMIARGHSVVAAAPAIDRATAAGLRELGAVPRDVEISNASLSPAALMQSIRSVRALIRETGPDVLLAYTVKPVIAAAVAGRAERVDRIVSLITGAGYAFTGGRELARLVSRLAASILYRVALRRSDVIVFQNRDDLQLFRALRLLPQHSNTHVVNGSGVDVDHFSPVPVPDRTAFLMIARLVTDKGIHEFADAARRLRSIRPEVPIVLVGDLDPGPHSLTEEELQDLIRCGVDYRGKLVDVRPAIAEASVYVLPSYREGTPRSVLEALAMGRAIVTTDAPGCRETVRDGENGFLVPPRDADALFNAMMRFVDQPGLAAVMGPKSRKIAEEKYDVRKVNADLLRYAGLSC